MLASGRSFGLAQIEPVHGHRSVLRGFGHDQTGLALRQKYQTMGDHCDWPTSRGKARGLNCGIESDRSQMAEEMNFGRRLRLVEQV
jgi:hypothetical protein